MRRKISIDPITVNRVEISVVIIDSHYEEKHGDHIDDELIIELVRLLDGRIELPEAEDENGFSYFVTLLEFEEKQYRLVWLLEQGEIYIGIINAFRDKKKR